MDWKSFSNSKGFIKFFRPITTLIWYLFMIRVGWIMLDFLMLHPIDPDGVQISLPNIISTIGIISAILITFIFSKLYAEKAEIVERKKRIQQLSAKINSLRKIIYVLFQKNEFWNNEPLLAKYHQLLQLAYNERIKSNNLVESDEKLNVLYKLSLLTGDIDDNYINYNTFNRIKYSQNDLESIYSTLDSLLRFMRENHQEFRSIGNFQENDKEIILENLRQINEKDIIKLLDNNVLRNSLEDYQQIFLEEHFVLLSLNSHKARRIFNYLMIDLFIFVLLIITGLIFLNISIEVSAVLFVNQLIVSAFVVTVIDILKNILLAVRFEFKAYGIKEN